MTKTQYIQQKEKSHPLFMKRGDILSEFFEISDKALEGGMGDVFFCRDRRDNKFYVLKTSSKASGTDEQLFTKECKFVLHLWKNPYVAYAKTVLSDAEHLYIVMEFVGKQPYNLQEAVQGETLARVMNKTQIEPKQALIWAIQFCQGMQFLNNAGMEAHKDIKPDNILVTSKNDIKITDFGLASAEKKGGTIGYRSPEYFAKDGRLTIASDIYSFGLVLYQMLNGGKVLPNATVWNENIKEYEKIDPATIKSEYCGDILKKCLAENPQQRYQSFAELEQALTKVLKESWPEYKFPKNIAEKMTANDYFLKGLGYYQLKENLWAFLLFSLAIFEDPKMAEAYYYRSKISVFPWPIRVLLIVILLGLFLTIPLWLYVAVTHPFADFWWNWIFTMGIYWMIGFIWLLYQFSKVLGWKAWKGLWFLGKNIFTIILGRDYAKACKLNPSYKSQ